MLEIKKNIPIIEKRFPFSKMEVGDCVDVPICPEYKNAQAAAYAHGTFTKKRFSAKRFRDEKFIRIWRIS